MKQPKIVIILNIAIIIFLLRYFFTFSNWFLDEFDNYKFYELNIKGLHKFYEVKIDDVIMYLLFLIVPLIIGIIVHLLSKLNYLHSYFIGVLIQWIVFLNINPYPLNLDNKYAIMNLMPKKNVPDQQFMLTEINEHDIYFPIIIKPVYCSGCNYNVTIIDNKHELNNLLKKIPAHKMNNYMVQTYLEDHNIEIGLLFEKMPGDKRGKIVEIYEKTGKDRIRKINKGESVNRSYLIDDDLNLIFNKLTNNIPFANCVRYDIRLKKIEDIKGRDFKIIEVNGTMGMNLSFVSGNFYNIIDGFKWYIRRWLVGFYNIITFKGYSPINLLIAMSKSAYSMHNCNIYENLYSLYS